MQKPFSKMITRFSAIESGLLWNSNKFERSIKMTEVLLNVLILSVIIYLIDMFLPAVHVKNFATAIIVAIVYSLLNFFLGWLFLFLSFPVVFLTLGLFKFVINAFFLWVTDKIVEGFKIKNFGWTLITALLISLGSTLVHAIL